MKKPLVVVLLAFTVAAATAVSAADTKAPRHGLQTVDSAWTKAMLANDPAACAALYAEDAVLVLPGSGAIKGKKAILDAYTGWMKDNKVVEAAVLDSHYASGGNVSSGWGAFKMTTLPKAGGAPVTETGTWCAVAVQKGGKWMYVADHASADPAPAPAAKK